MKKRNLSDEQKAAAAERLRLAREKRQAERGRPQNVHPDVYNHPEHYYLSYNKVRQWIKSNKEQLPILKRAVRQNVKGSIAELASVSAYIRHMEWYIRTADWIDNYYGESQEHKISWKTTREAYDEDGCVK